MESGYSSASSPSLSVISNDSSCPGLDTLHIFSQDGSDIQPMAYNNRGFQYSLDISSMQTSAQLVIIEEPVEKFRFRYKSEMHGTHGSLMGSTTEKSKKTFPSVELRGYDRRAIIRCSLYQVEVTQPHSHRLVVRKGDEDISDPHDVSVSPEDGFRAVFQGMGIIHTAKKHIVEELIAKKEKERKFELGGRQLTTREMSQIKLNAEKEAKAMNLNQVCLGFQAFGIQNDGSWVKLCEPVFSRPINNMKSALTGELKISRMSAGVSSAAGHEDLFLFVEKVGKKNIKVRFFEVNKYDEEIWEGYGSFCEADVHHQYAIALHTPPYKSIDIEKSVDVFIQLVRPSDDDRSPPLPFKYKPRDSVISRKRARMSSSTFSSSELPESVVSGNMNTEEMGPTISEEFGKEKFLHQFLDEYRSDSDELQKMFLPLSDMLDKDSAGSKKATVQRILMPDSVMLDKDSANSNKTSVIQRTSQQWNVQVPKVERPSLEKIYKILRTYRSNLGKAREMIMQIFMDENIIHNAIIINDSIAIMKVLEIINKLDLNEVLQFQNASRETCLHFACLYDRAEYIKSLINLGADPNIGNKKGDTPLHIAVEENKMLCVSKIIEKSHYTTKSKPLQIDLANDEGLTPLHLAARKKNLPLVQKLLEIGKASTKIAIAKNGNNVLHIAVEENDKDMVKYLVENTTVKINEPNTCGHTALQLAYCMPNISKEIIDILSKYNTGSEASKIMCNPSSTSAGMEMEESSTDEDEDEKPLKIDEESDNILTKKCIEELSMILNKDQKWKDVAKRLDMKGIIKVWEKAPNPSKTMLNFINDEESIRLDEILTVMADLKMDDALEYINKSRSENP